MLQLPIGYDDFSEILDHKLDFIDKSLFIKDILDNETTKAIVLTRPRRFGKTFNLSLLHHFLAPTAYSKSTQSLFDQLNIAHCGNGYMQHQGKYPVISITFKDIKDTTFETALKSLCVIFQMLYTEHSYLLTSPQLQTHEKLAYQKFLESDLTDIDEARLKFALKQLIQWLYQHHGIKPWLLIDEYDTPIYAAHLNKYYNEMIDFMRGLFGSALKNNPYLYKAVITGILRIAKERLFSGVNNLEVYSVLRDEYSQYFGFTEKEVDGILTKSNLVEKTAEIKAWYNGYQFGNTTIYNPWSIVNCLKQKGKTQPYWINTSSNDLIKDLLKQAPLQFKTEFEALMQGNTTEQLIDENIVFSDLERNPAAVWSLLLMFNTG